ncbi:hypothetical protein TWF281_010549 [Arthrobotrys megalospora]
MNARYANEGSGYVIHILLGQPGELDGRISLRGNTIPAGTVIALGTGLASVDLSAAGADSYKIVPNDHDFPEIDRLNQVAEITTFLRHSLHWRVTDRTNHRLEYFGGNILDTDVDDFKDLRVSAAIGKMEYYNDVALPPEFGNYEVVAEITEHKQYGLKANEIELYYPVDES